MKKNITLSILLALSLSTSTAIASVSETETLSPVIQDLSKTSFDLIVTFKDKQVHKSLLSSPEVERMINSKAEYSSLNVEELKRKYNVKGAETQDYGVQKLGVLSQKYNTKFNHVRSMAMSADLIKVEAKSSVEAKKIVLDMMASGDFENVMIDIPMKKQSFNDPLYEEQKYFKPVSLFNFEGQDYEGMRAKVESEGRTIRIGIADTGYLPHEDIKPFEEGYDFSTSTNPLLAEDDTRDADPLDMAILAAGGFCSDGHGLSVAGLIAATSDNGLGVAGAVDSESVDLVYARVLDCFGNGNTSNTLDAVAWLSGDSVPGIPDISEKVDIINLSLGGYSASGCSTYTQKVYSNARKKGILVVAAAGNSNSDASTFVPAACDDVVTVGATTNSGDKASYSNYGEHIDVMAAGTNVWMLSSTEFGKQKLYFQGSGTSMASPNIAAGAANLLLTHPELTPVEVERMLVANGKGNVKGSICDQLMCGSGAVDMGKLMDTIPALPTLNTYKKVNRYENYNSEAQTEWLRQLSSFNNVCNTVKYTWGQTGGELSGVAYKLFQEEEGEMVYKETVVSPQKVYELADSVVVGVQACKDGSCGSILRMTGEVAKPNYCKS